MASRSRPRRSGPGKAAPPRPGATQEAGGLRPRLQILAGFLLPLVVLALWLNSRGFFAGP